MSTSTPQFDPEKFLAAVAVPFLSRPLWDLFDDVSFWVKDASGRFVWVNNTLAAQAGTDRDSIVGSRDSDWFFNELASVYMDDDAKLLVDGEPIINKPELVMGADGIVEWHQTTKHPCVDGDGKIVGTYGMSRPMAKGRALPAEYADLAKILDYARERITRGIQVAELAKFASMSLSSLERYVQRHLKISPQQLLRRLRMNRARHLLKNSNLKVAEIALECGYESFSSFNRAFRRHYDCSPGVYRRST